MRVVTVKIPEHLLIQIDLLAKKLGMNRSELIREAVKYYISLYRKKEIGVKETWTTEV